MIKFTYDEKKSEIILEDGTKLALTSKEAFNIISKAWIRSGWDTKYVYGFSWFGRPIIQLPEDLIRIQEVIYQIKPDFVIETGVAHGGSLIFYATLLKAIGQGEVIGIDIDIRKHNREAIEKHELSSLVTLIEGDSTLNSVFEKVKNIISQGEKILVILDSNHSKEHVLKELNLYGSLVSAGSYIVACDGVMKQVKGGSRTHEDWEWDNPLTAINEFLKSNKNFIIEEPKWPFNEGVITERVTYWPNAFLKKRN